MNESRNRLLPIVLIWSLLMAALFAVPHLFTLGDPGDFLIRNTIRVSLLFWFGAMFRRIHQPERRRERLLWSLAWLAFIVHVVMAFEHYHRWSHRSAIDHVQSVSGYGPGLFVSYTFTLLWTLDVLQWWLAPSSRKRRPVWLNRLWYGFMIFVIVNGAIVYETGIVRYFTVAAFLLLVVFWDYNSRWIRKTGDSRLNECHEDSATDENRMNTG